MPLSGRHLLRVREHLSKRNVPQSTKERVQGEPGARCTQRAHAAEQTCQRSGIMQRLSMLLAQGPRLFQNRR